jgi:hypothetical protein
LSGPVRGEEACPRGWRAAPTSGFRLRLGRSGRRRRAKQRPVVARDRGGRSVRGFFVQGRPIAVPVGGPTSAMVVCLRASTPRDSAPLDLSGERVDDPKRPRQRLARDVLQTRPVTELPGDRVVLGESGRNRDGSASVPVGPSSNSITTWPLLHGTSSRLPSGTLPWRCAASARWCPFTPPLDWDGRPRACRRHARRLDQLLSDRDVGLARNRWVRTVTSARYWRPAWVIVAFQFGPRPYRADQPAVS